jgi:hypothetical protein
MGKRRDAIDTIHRAYVRGYAFSPVKSQETSLLAYGVTPRAIYVEGRGPETLGALTKAVRSGQFIGVVGGYRVFGENRKQIMAAVRAIRARGGIIIDIETGERSDREGDEMLDRAIRRIHGEATFGSPDRAAELGAQGGTARSQAMKAARLSVKLARRIWFDKSITTAEAVERMGPGWSKPTAIREFGKSGRPRGAFRPKK